jgi:PspAB-like protein
VGFLDALIGGRRKLKGPAPDRLFAMSTAYVTLQTGLDITPAGSAGIVFQPLATADFQSIVKETEELVRGAAADSGTKVETADDEFGFRWIVLRDPDFEDLVVALNTVSGELQGGGYGERLLACVFPFEEKAGGEGKAKRLYFIYNFKRGAFYPFVPAPGEKARDTERELRLKAQVGADLPFEQETTRWFPLWEIPL